MISTVHTSLFAFLLSKPLFAQDVEYSTSTSGHVSPAFIIFWLLVTVFLIAAMWKVFSKAGKPGWACLIPIYNLYVWCKIVGRPGWWIILMLIPLVNLVVCIIVYVALAKAFGKGVGFALGLIFLGFIFFPILAFGDATYHKPS